MRHFTDAEIAILRKDEMCKCGHRKISHYNSKGVCLGIGGGGHICCCIRFAHSDRKANLALRNAKKAITEAGEQPEGGK